MGVVVDLGDLVEVVDEHLLISVLQETILRVTTMESVVFHQHEEVP